MARLLRNNLIHLQHRCSKCVAQTSLTFTAETHQCSIIQVFCDKWLKLFLNYKTQPCFFFLFFKNVPTLHSVQHLNISTPCLPLFLSKNFKEPSTAYGIWSAFIAAADSPHGEINLALTESWRTRCLFRVTLSGPRSKQCSLQIYILLGNKNVIVQHTDAAKQKVLPGMWS